MTYAARTDVSSDRTRAEIERVLVKYGATEFAYAWSTSEARIAFAMADRRIMFRLPLPDRRDRVFTHTPSQGQLRSNDAATQAYEQAVRARWRALLLILKAKLEAVASGVVTLESEFLAHVLLPDGSTVGDWAKPQLAVVYEQNTMPALMPGATR
jgi:hypothetical protein